MKDSIEQALAGLLDEKQLAQYGRLLVMTALKINAEANAVMQSIVAAGIDGPTQEPARPRLAAATRTVKLAEAVPAFEKPTKPSRKPSAKRTGPGEVDQVDGWLTKLGVLKAHNIPAYTLTRIQKKCKTKTAQVIGPDGRRYHVTVIEPNSLDKAIKAYYKEPDRQRGRPPKTAAKQVIQDDKYTGAVAGAALGLSAGAFYSHGKRLSVGLMTSRPGGPPAKLYSTADIMLVSKDMGIPFNAARLNGAA